MKPSLAHWGQYGGLRLLEEVASRLSWEGRCRAGRLLGRAWHVLDRGHRRVATDNVQRAFPDWSPERVASLVRRNFEHLGATAAESLGLAHTEPQELLAHCRFVGLENLDAALADGRGVLVLSAHLGNWELTGLALAARGYPVYAVGRRQTNPLIDLRVTRLRESYGGTLIHHRQAVRPVLKALNGGGVVGFLMDQRASGREAVKSSFFGQPVATNQGLAILALKTGAPVVPGFAERVEGGHVVCFHRALRQPGEGSREERVKRHTATFDATIEEAVRKRPEQWFWVHRRWRLPRSWLP